MRIIRHTLISHGDEKGPRPFGFVTEGLSSALQRSVALSSRLRINLWAVLPMVVLALMATAASFAAPSGAGAQDPSGVYQLSYELEAAGKYRAASEALNRAPTSQRDTYVFQLRQAWLLYMAQDYNASISSYTKAIRTSPDAIEPKLGVMLPQMALRRWVDVEKTARQVLNVDPLNYLAKSRLAYALYNLGRYPDAERHYAKLHTLYPGDVDMAAGLAWAMLKQGRSQDAAAIFQEILLVAPRHASALEGLSAAGQ
ncbi:MAG: tetratricopeptide repeat protein [Myxococcota bacterium]